MTKPSLLRLHRRHASSLGLHRRREICVRTGLLGELLARIKVGVEASRLVLHGLERLLLHLGGACHLRLHELASKPEPSRLLLLSSILHGNLPRLLWLEVRGVLLLQTLLCQVVQTSRRGSHAGHLRLQWWRPETAGLC